MMAMMQQLMVDPSMMERFMQENRAPPKMTEDPALTAMLEPIRDLKKTGAQKFKAKDAAGALAAYQSAVISAGSTHSGALAWPQAETLVYACRSNAALCLLQLGRSDEAIAECDAALTMPCSNGSELLPKVLARKLQGLIDADRKRSDVFDFLDELRRRGVFDQGWSGGQPKVVEQVARLSAAETGSAAERAFDVLTEHWLSASVITQTALDAATDRVASALPATRERSVMLEFSVLAAPRVTGRERLTVNTMIRQLYTSFSDADNEAQSAEETAMVLRYALSGGMHPSFPGTIDPDADGYLLWGLVTAFERSRYTPEDIRTFLLCLDVLTDGAGADINQRVKEGQRLPLMYVARTGCLDAVQAMISKGANLHLRDEEGWTSLLCCCMNDTPATDADERVACLKALLDAGSDVNAQTVMGGSAMFCAASHDSPHFALMNALLEVGADASIRSKVGDSVTTYLQTRLEDKKFKAIHDELEGMLNRIKAAAGPRAQLEAQTMKFHGFINSVLVPAYNEGVDTEALAKRKKEMKGVLKRMSTGAITEGDKAGFHERYEQERRVLAALMRSLGMDAGLLNRRTLASDGNWLGELHRCVYAMIPQPFLTVYCEREPTDDEIGLFSVIADEEDRKAAKVDTGGVRTWDQAMLRRLVTVKFRNRGLISKTMLQNIWKLVFEPVKHAICFAVPSDGALATLAEHAPLIEVGAGTGYWSAVLQQRGVDILAFDSEPPSTGMSNNFFYDFSFTDVQKGSGTTLFKEHPELAKRALVLVWPNNPDHEDNPEVVLKQDREAATPIWDADCLEAYMAAGGTKVIYVGERESQIRLVDSAGPRDSGITGSRRFQSMLQKHFTLERQVEVLNWFTNVDDLTVWVLKAPVAIG